MRHALLVPLVAIAFILGVACGQPKSSEPPPPEQPVSGDASSDDTHTLSDDTRAQVLDAALAQWKLAHRPDGTVDQEQLLAWLRSQSAFAASDLSAGGLWARFTDGRRLVFAITPPSENSDGGLDGGVRGRQHRAASHQVPDGTKALALEGMGCNPPRTTGFVANWLNERGYQAEKAPASVANFRRLVNGVSVLYVNTHGAPGGLWTTDEYRRNEGEVDPTIRADLAEHLLAYMVADDKDNGMGNCYEALHYGITTAFIRKYWRLAQDSLAFVNACSSAAVYAELPTGDGGTGADAGTDGLPNAVGDAGGGFFIGWSDRVLTYLTRDAAGYVFDLFLSENFYDKLPQPQRPWSWEAVKDGVARHAVLGETPLEFIPLGGNFGGLRPSIAYFEINEWEGKEGRIYITGSFGEDLGADSRLMIGDVEIDKSDIVQWDDQEIQADLPSSASGDVVVISRGKESNPVPLTSWELEMNYEWRPEGTMLEAMDCHVHFRGDAHGFRTRADEEPPTGKTPGNFLGMDIVHDFKTHCNFSAQGTGTWVAGVGGEPVTLFGSGTITDLEDLSLEATADPVTHELTMNFVASSKQDAITVTNQHYSGHAGVNFQTETFSGVLNNLKLDIDDDWNVKAMTLQGLPGYGYSLSISAAHATNPPRRNGSNPHPR